MATSSSESSTEEGQIIEEQQIQPAEQALQGEAPKYYRMLTSQGKEIICTPDGFEFTFEADSKLHNGNYIVWFCFFLNFH
jgi:hypothetical protein